MNDNCHTPWEKHMLINAINDAASLQKELTSLLMFGKDFKRDCRNTGEERIAKKFLGLAAILDKLLIPDDSNDMTYVAPEKYEYGNNRYWKIRVEYHLKNNLDMGNIPPNQYAETNEMVNGMLWLIRAMHETRMYPWITKETEKLYIQHKHNFIKKLKELITVDYVPDNKMHVYNAVVFMVEELTNNTPIAEKAGYSLPKILEAINEFIDRLDKLGSITVGSNKNG